MDRETGEAADEDETNLQAAPRGTCVLHLEMSGPARGQVAGGATEARRDPAYPVQGNKCRPGAFRVRGEDPRPVSSPTVSATGPGRRLLGSQTGPTPRPASVRPIRFRR